MSNQKTVVGPSKTVFIWATLGAIGTILLFGVIVWYLYYTTSKGPVTEDIVAQRMETLAEVNATQKELISTYAWVDKENGVVRIPIEHAMDLTIKELKEPKGRR